MFLYGCLSAGIYHWPNVWVTISAGGLRACFPDPVLLDQPLSDHERRLSGLGPGFLIQESGALDEDTSDKLETPVPALTGADGRVR